MRLFVGKIVDVDKEVNLADLSPIDRIIAAAKNAYYNTTMYKRRYAETEEKIEEQKRKIRETLAESILYRINEELINNKTLGKKNDKCIAIVLKIPYRFKNFIEDVITSMDFDIYTCVVIPPSKDLEKFCEAPYLLYIEHRGG